MSRAHLSLILLIAVAALCGLALLIGCHDDPVGPRPHEPTDYRVYFRDAYFCDSNWYYTYHPSTNDLDSVFLLVAGGPVISADGSKMYVVSDCNGGPVLVLDTDSLNVIEELPYEGVYGESPDGRYLVVYTSGGFRVLNAYNHAELYASDRVLAGNISFSTNGRHLYGYWLYDTVYQLDLSDGRFSMTTKAFPGWAIRGVVPSPDESLWYLYLLVSSHSDYVFAVYDVAADSIIFTQPLWPGTGEIAVTRKGRYVFYTNPGNMLYGPGAPWIYVYDSKTNSKADSISTIGVFAPPREAGVLVGELYITPDDRWMAISDRDYGYVATVDLQSQTIKHYCILGGYRAPVGLTGQNGY